MKKLLLIAGLTGCCVMISSAQRRGRGGWGGGGGGGWGGGGYYDEVPRTAREVWSTNDQELPVWTNPPAHTKDVFTFARLVYTRNRYGGGRGGGGWRTDLPDSDINLSFRLQQMTSMRTDPDGRNLRLSDPELPNYPFLYVVEPGGLYLDDDEAKILREYLLNGGFLMMDDFWGDNEWENCAEQMKKVFPEKEFVELPMDHPVYHCVFEIKTRGQVPNMQLGDESQYTGETWEREDARETHHRGISDDKGRLMVIACHNTDNGDGWEREGWSDYYFHNFSEKIAYPLGINIIFYAMTH